MAPEDLDEWIIQKSDSFVVERKMRDEDAHGVGIFYFVHLLNDAYGMNVDRLLEVRASLTRLLKAGRIHAVGINGWSTYDGCPVTPQRRKDAEDVIAGRADRTKDLWGWDSV